MSDTERDRVAEVMHAADCGCRGNFRGGPCPMLPKYRSMAEAQQDALANESPEMVQAWRDDFHALHREYLDLTAERDALAAKVADYERRLNPAQGESYANEVARLQRLVVHLQQAADNALARKDEVLATLTRVEALGHEWLCNARPADPWYWSDAGEELLRALGIEP